MKKKQIAKDKKKKKQKLKEYKKVEKKKDLIVCSIDEKESKINSVYRSFLVTISYNTFSRLFIEKFFQRSKINY